MSSKKISLIKKAITEIGDRMLKEYDRFDRRDIELKSKHEIVTKADRLAEKLIIKKIKDNFPQDGILSEEAGLLSSKKEKEKKLWIIDPIDGTTNFSMHNPLWSISVALTEYNKRLKSYEPVFGMVYAPVLGEIFTAEKGGGAKLNNRKINVSGKTKDKVLNAFCHGSDEKSIKKALNYHRKQKLNGFDCRQMGSAAIELAYVACGRIESLMIPGVNSWDVAAGALLVTEAGGRVTDFNNKKWHTESKDILASNGKIHSKLLKTINS